MQHFLLLGKLDIAGGHHFSKIKTQNPALPLPQYCVSEKKQMIPTFSSCFVFKTQPSCEGTLLWLFPPFPINQECVPAQTPPTSMKYSSDSNRNLYSCETQRHLCSLLCICLLHVTHSKLLLSSCTKASWSQPQNHSSDTACLKNAMNDHVLILSMHTAVLIETLHEGFCC